MCPGILQYFEPCPRQLWFQLSTNAVPVDPLSSFAQTVTKFFLWPHFVVRNIWYFNHCSARSPLFSFSQTVITSFLWSHFVECTANSVSWRNRAFVLWICRPLFPAPLWLRSASGFKSQSMGQCFFLSLQYPGNSCGTGCVDCSPNPCVHRGVEGTWILWMYLLSLLSALFWNDRLFSIPSVYCVVTIMCIPANKVITFLIFNVKYLKLTVVCAESGGSSSKVG